MKKASIQLSINFIVVLILAIVVMGLGFTLMRNMMDDSDKNFEQLEGKLEKQMQQILVDNHEVVILFPDSIDVSRGGFGGTAVAIQNINQRSNSPPRKFYLDVYCKKLILPNEDVEELDSNSENCNDWILSIDINQVIEIKSNEEYISTIGIQVPKNAKQGTYIYDVSVTDANDVSDYGTKQKLYVNVK